MKWDGLESKHFKHPAQLYAWRGGAGHVLFKKKKKRAYVNKLKNKQT